MKITIDTATGEVTGADGKFGMLILALRAWELAEAAIERAEKAELDAEALEAGSPGDATYLAVQLGVHQDRIERAAMAIKAADRWARCSQIVRTATTEALWVRAEGVQKSRGLHRHALAILSGGESEWVGGEPPADFSWEEPEPVEENEPEEKAPEAKATKKKATKKKATKKKATKKKATKKKATKKKAAKKKAVEEKFLTLAEVSEITRTPLSSVRAWCRDGRLASCRPGRRRMVRESDLTVFLKTSPVPRTNTRVPPLTDEDIPF